MSRAEVFGKISEALEAMKEGLHGKVTKTYPMRSEWRKRYAELDKADKEADVAQEKRNTLKRAFWSQVEIDLGIYDKNLHYNPETDEVEVMESED